MDRTRNWLEKEGFIDPISYQEKEKIGYPLDKELTVNEYFDREQLLQESKEKFERECRLCNDSEMCKIVKGFGVDICLLLLPKNNFWNVLKIVEGVSL